MDEPIKIVVEQAGVGPGHPKDKCDRCGVPLNKEDAIATCSHEEYLTLCQDCCHLAGNSVRS